MVHQGVLAGKRVPVSPAHAAGLPRTSDSRPRTVVFVFFAVTRAFLAVVEIPRGIGPGAATCVRVVGGAD